MTNDQQNAVQAYRGRSLDQRLADVTQRLELHADALALLHGEDGPLCVMLRESVTELRACAALGREVKL